MGMTIEALASSIGCTASYISQLERDLLNPSLDRLYAIAESLSVPVSYFFNTSVLENPVVRANERKQICSPSESVVYEILTPSQTGLIEVFDNTLEPGASAGDKFFVHVGEEFGLVMEGTMEIELGGDVHRLEKGDSICFNSETPHRFRNAGSKRLRVLWAITPPSLLRFEVIDSVREGVKQTQARLAEGTEE